MFPFGSVAKQSLAKLRNSLSEHPTAESKLLEEEALLELFLPNDLLWMNVMISCFALSCLLQFCILTDSTLGVKGFSFFSWYSSQRGFFAKKCSRMMFCLAYAFCLAVFMLTYYSNTSVADRKFFLSCWLLKPYRVGTSQLTSVLFIYLKLKVYFFGKEFVIIFNSTFLFK